MKNKFALSLLLAGALTGISIGIGQAVIEAREAPIRAAAVARYQEQQRAAAPSPEEVEAKAIDEQRAALEAEAAAALDRLHSGQVAPDDSYRGFLARQQQRKADLEYCAKNRADWSCTDGQYAGQY